MEPVEPIRKNAQHKDCRKRVVTKNELKRILTYYTSHLPCVVEACKVEKRELNSQIKCLQEDVRAKDASIKILRENLSTMRLTIREFSCFIASNHPGTTIAAAAQAWEKRWKSEDEEGLWNVANSPKIQSAVRRHRSYVKPSTSSVANISVANNVQLEKAQLVSPQQNNIFHDFARKNAVAISRFTNSRILRKSSTNLEQFISPSHTAATNNDNCPSPQSQTAATAHALITVNQPLSLPMSSDTSSHNLITTGSQYKNIQANNSQISGQDVINHSLANCSRLNNAEMKRKNRDEPISIKKVQRSEIVSDVIVLSDDEGDEKLDVMTEDMVTIPRYDSINSLRCKKSHPLVYPRLRIYPGLRISHITKTKHIILNVRYAGEYSKQIFHILYYIRSMVEKEEAEGWTRIYSKECEAGGNSRLRIQFDESQTWFNDAIYFTGFIECGLERYGAYADVCKVELGLQDKQIPASFTRRYWP
uniref:MATH domain-containing protein n=1 Tax=Elaeophora elaphi TaxID=1147741 RepID=A0A0R3RIX9_9BILA